MKKQAGMATENTVVSYNAGNSYYFQAAERDHHGLFIGLRVVSLLLAFALVLMTTACNRKEAAPASQSASEPTAHPAPAPAAQPAKAAEQSLAETNEPDHALVLPLNFSRHTGDLDEMVKQRNIRALVVNSRTGFFYDKGQPTEFFTKHSMNSRSSSIRNTRQAIYPIKVTFLPCGPIRSNRV